MINIGLSHYLVLAAIIFTIGIAGIFLNRKNIIVILNKSPEKETPVLKLLMLKKIKELRSMLEIGLGHYLTLGAIIFTIGIAGIFLNRKNIIVILMSIELILLTVNINLVSFSAFLNDLTGQIFTLFILTVAAAEAAIGLAIIVVYFRNSGTIRVEEIDKLKG